MNKQLIKRVHVGDFVAEVEVTLNQDKTGWSPYISLTDARKLDAVRKALQENQLETAAKIGKIFKMVPVAV